MFTYIVAAILIALVWWVVKRRGVKDPLDSVIPGDPFSFTDLYKAIKDPLPSNTTALLEKCKRYPKIFKSQILTLKLYVVSDPTILKDMMLVKTDEFANHISGIIQSEDKILTLKSLINLKDNEWRERRKLLNPFFATTKINPLVPLFVEQSKIFCKKLEKEKDNLFEVRSFTTALTLDVLGEAVFGVNFDTQNNPNNPISSEVVNWIDSSQLLTFIPILPYWHKYPLKTVRDFINGQDRLAKICIQVADIRKKPENRRDDLLQSLIDANLSIESIVADSLLFLIAGHETTSTSLSWAFYLISQHPEVEKKIVEELNTILKGEPPTSENVNNLKYLGAVIDETLRIYPPAVVTTRQSSSEAEIDGIKFPKGTSFLIPIWALHHNEKYWPEPEKFIPERWLDRTKIVSNTYMPFGLGPRMCIGFKFSLTESKVLLAMVYQRFTFKYHEKTPPKSSGNSLLRPVNLKLSAHLRD